MRTQDSSLELREQLNVLRRRKWWILLTTLLALALSLGLTLRQDERYSATARLLIESDGPLPPELNTESQRVASVPVARKVIELLELDTTPGSLLSGLSVRGVADEGSVIAVSYTSSDPEFAAAAANAFAESYITHLTEQATAEIDRASTVVRELIASTQQELEEVISAIERERASGTPDRVASLESDRTRLTASLGALEQRLADVQLSEGSAPPTGEVLAPAEVPGSPSSPDLTRNLIFAGLAGLAVGIAIAFMRERLDDTFKDRFELERATGAPVLGTIPRFASVKDEAPLLLRDPNAIASEAYRNLRANLDFAISHGSIRSILITSAESGEGKTETARNLGIALAWAGHRVLLVSADLRRSTLEKSLGVVPGLGLSDWLMAEEGRKRPSGSTHLRLHIQETKVPNLLMMPSGPTPNDPAELLGTKHFETLITKLQNAFDVVLLDSPPVLPVADPVVLAGLTHATLLVVQAGKTRRAAAALAVSQLKAVGAHLMGTVLNSFDPSASTLPAYGAYSYISREAPVATGATPKRRPARSRAETSAPSSTGRPRRRSTDPPPPPPTTR